MFDKVGVEEEEEEEEGKGMIGLMREHKVSTGRPLLYFTAPICTAYLTLFQILIKLII